MGLFLIGLVLTWLGGGETQPHHRLQYDDDSSVREVVPVKEIKREKEVIREKVVVKIRCRYCGNPYNETLDECPHCGARH